MSKATRKDVLDYYRALLGRAPESEEVIAAQLKGAPSRLDLITRFLQTTEFTRKVIGRRAGDLTFYYHGLHQIEIDGTSTQLEHLFDHVRQSWSALGAEDPHFSVMTNPVYRRQNMSPKVEEDFYKTGLLDTNVFLKLCERNDVTPKVAGTVVELGCGVGRITEHLSKVFRNYIGVDISAPHLALAHERVEKIGLTNVSLVLLSDFLSDKTTYDVLFSLIVLQHNPPPVIEYLLEGLLGRLNPGGIAFFQVPSTLFGYNFVLQDYLRKIKADKGMEMHALPQRRVFEILRRNNCELIEVVFDGKAADMGFSYSYFARKA